LTYAVVGSLGLFEYAMPMVLTLPFKPSIVSTTFERLALKTNFANSVRHYPGASWLKRGKVSKNEPRSYVNPYRDRVPSVAINRKADYLYGHNVIIPAIENSRRAFFKIYVKRDRSIRTPRDK
jgi:hypothetical protein